MGIYYDKNYKDYQKIGNTFEIDSYEWNGYTLVLEFVYDIDYDDDALYGRHRARPVARELIHYMSFDSNDNPVDLTPAEHAKLLSEACDMIDASDYIERD